MGINFLIILFYSEPSSPPSDLKLNPINSYSVRVRWQPPAEPNGIIIEYIILYNANYTQSDELWNSLSKEGGSQGKLLKWSEIYMSINYQSYVTQMHVLSSVLTQER